MRRRHWHHQLVSASVWTRRIQQQYQPDRARRGCVPASWPTSHHIKPWVHLHFLWRRRFGMHLPSFIEFSLPLLFHLLIRPFCAFVSTLATLEHLFCVDLLSRFSTSRAPASTYPHTTKHPAAAFTSNFADYGGAIYVQDSSLSLNGTVILQKYVLLFVPATYMLNQFFLFFLTSFLRRAFDEIN